MMNLNAITSPEDQSVTFIELFFDLVFVFSITQVVSILHDGLTLEIVGQAILVFWLVWWAWTQFTWALNAANTHHYLIEIGTLLATGIAFLMAVALPDAFQDRALLFAVLYIVMRVIGTTLYILVAAQNPTLRAPLRNFTIASIAGMVTVLIGGLLGGTEQYLFWGITIVLDIIATVIGGQSEGWSIFPGHFTERHGLFVIIVLGETLIVAASGVTGEPWTGDLVTISIVAVAVTCSLWWSYYPQAKPALDHVFEATLGVERTRMARDAFSLLHFPMVCGVIAYAIVIEEAVHHPADPLHIEIRFALAVGLVLFVGGMALALWRVSRQLLLPRLLIIAITAIIIVVVADVPAPVSLVIAFAGILIVALIELRTLRPITALSHN